MLSVEQEPIRLPTIVNEVDGPEGRVIRFADGKTVLLPRRFQYLWEQSKVGASIYDLSQRLRTRGESPRVFLDVASYLCFLVDHDLIDDVRVVRMADSIRGEYEWPRDLVSEYSVSSLVATWGRRAHSRLPFASRSFDFMTAIFVFLSIPFSVSLSALLFDAGGLSGIHVGLLFVAGFLFGGIFGRTGVAIFRSFASKIGGDAGELRITIDCLGPHLSFEPQTVTGGFRRFSDFVICFGASTIPLMLLLLIKSFRPDIEVNVWVVMLYGSLFVTALSTHPATQSGLTRSLRIWNRTPLVWREDDELREVEAFHRIGGFLSILIAALFFGGVLAAFVKVSPDMSVLRSHFTSVIVVLGLWLFTVIVYVEPFFRHEILGSAKRNKRRRLWATRTKVLTVAAAEREAWNELPVLRQLTAPLRRQLMSVARVIEYQAGQAVCKQGGTDRSLFIVLEGRLAVAKSYEGRRRKVVAILSEGAVFGETAFFFGQPRTADVVAMDSCQMLEIPYVSSMKNLDISSSEEFQFRVWLLQALSGSPMLKDLPSEAMDTLIFAGTRRTFRPGEAIFTEGAPATTCYFIAQGRASAIQQGRKIREMGAGDAFGEIALLHQGSRRTASVVADSDLLCMELEVDPFWALLAARLPLGAEIERLAIRRLKDDEERRESRRPAR